MIGVVIENTTDIRDSGGVMHLMRHNDNKSQQHVNCKHIVIIIRLTKNRALVYPEEDSAPHRRGKKTPLYKTDYRIIRAFQDRFGADKVVPYFGNISTEETVEVFSNACAVVGPHGAATANIVFSQPNTYVLELSTHDIDMNIVPNRHPNLTIDYISNVEAGMGTGVTWDLYKIGWDKIFPPFTTFLLHAIQQQGANTTFIQIKANSRAIHNHINFKTNFVLDLADFAAIVELTCTNVKHLSKHMSSC
jgi:hypothetical protein